jgi:hypothetical protein
LKNRVQSRNPATVLRLTGLPPLACASETLPVLTPCLRLPVGAGRDLRDGVPGANPNPNSLPSNALPSTDLQPHRHGPARDATSKPRLRAAAEHHGTPSPGPCVGLRRSRGRWRWTHRDCREAMAPIVVLAVGARRVFCTHKTGASHGERDLEKACSPPNATRGRSGAPVPKLPGRWRHGRRCGRGLAALWRMTTPSDQSIRRSTSAG